MSSRHIKGTHEHYECCAPTTETVMPDLNEDHLDIWTAVMIRAAARTYVKSTCRSYLVPGILLYK